MLPAGLLMKEHRLIEKMISLMRKEIDRIKKHRTADAAFIEKAVDFMRTYADRCHHGKEEDILFRELSKKTISDDHRRIMDELTKEHVLGRDNVKSLEEVGNACGKGDKEAPDKVISILGTLVEFYPRHIEKEDKHFFLEVMDYFDDREKQAMLDEFGDFDRELIHEKYRNIVRDIEELSDALDLPACERTATGEHARLSNEDNPCKGGRSPIALTFREGKLALIPGQGHSRKTSIRRQQEGGEWAAQPQTQSAVSAFPGEGPSAPLKL